MLALRNKQTGELNLVYKITKENDKVSFLTHEFYYDEESKEVKLYIIERLTIINVLEYYIKVNDYENTPVVIDEGVLTKVSEVIKLVQEKEVYKAKRLVIDGISYLLIMYSDYTTTMSLQIETTLKEN